jgi:FMN phosphatase YigB (HAD superfamily)
MVDAIAVFFDIGDTLAVPKASATGVLEGLEVFPFVTEILTKLHATTGPGGAVLKLGIISNTGDVDRDSMKAFLTTAGLLGFFEDKLLVFSHEEGVDKKTKEIFNRARTRAGVAANRCIFVGESEDERTVASSANFRVSFHALHVFHVIKQVGP